ncbi:MAG: hypothetical protein M0015_08950 [Betaproteobacteria bacterium]|nr:hypothetical protein [Betaproteobacteria bacterium]
MRPGSASAGSTPARRTPAAARAPLLALGFVALVLGVDGGLVRLGFALPAPAAGVAWHGALMASAFFGTLISLERAVAIGRPWAYGAPAACGAGGIALLLRDAQLGFALLAAGAALYVAASTAVYLRQRALHTGVLALGALGLLAANLVLAAGLPSETAVPSWFAFLALTIGGERLELSRLVPVPKAARRAFAALSVAVLAAALLAVWRFDAGLRLCGALLLLSAAWLARYDIATRTVHAKGLTRYIALCLLAGYAWLAFGGALLAARDVLWSGRELWDAALHAVLIGYVFSMVFGHAPVILPAVLRVAFPYRAVLYVPLALLHAALAVRVVGDLAGSAGWRAAGGAGNALAIALFIVTAAALVWRGGARSG